MTPNGERFSLVLRAVPGGVPATIRLRRALKMLWRAYQLRAEDIRDLPAEPDKPKPPRPARAKVARAEPSPRPVGLFPGGWE